MMGADRFMAHFRRTEPGRLCASEHPEYEKHFLRSPLQRSLQPDVGDSSI